MNTGTNENNLRELAYRIWEAEGRPIGQAERHWRMAMEQASSTGQDDFTTGDNFLGEKITPENESVPDERLLQASTLLDETTQATMEADALNTAQQSASGQKQKGGKRKNGKIKTDDTFADQDMAATPRSKPGRRKASDNILV